MFFDMEVAIYSNMEARRANKSLFKRMVVNPDVFEYDAFIRSMRSVFGSQVIIEFVIV